MRRAKDIESVFALLTLLTLAGQPTPNALAASLVVNAPPIQVKIEQPTQRCQILDVPEAGRYWLVTTSKTPSTAPLLLVLGLEGSDPRTVGWVEMTLLDFAEPGEHAACRTSDLASEDTRWTLALAGDPLEIEEVLDPVWNPVDPANAGDEYEIEEVLDP